MKILQAGRRLAAGLLALLAATAAANPAAYTDTQLRLLYDEAAAIGAQQYSFYILGSKDEAVLRDQQRRLSEPRTLGRSLKVLHNMTASREPAYALPAVIREELRRLAETERSGVFRLDKESWVLVELESVTPAAMPPFAQLRGALPRLVASGALPDPERLATDHELVQRSQLNKVNSSRDFDRLPPGIDPDMVLSSGYTLLQQALLREDTALVSALLKRRANPNLCPMRTCPLQMAARSTAHGASFTRQLLAAGARPDQIASVSGDDTPLTLASRLGQFDVAELLLGAGADANGGPGGVPPLSLAVHRGHVDLTKLLLERGADPLFSKPFANTTTATPLSVALNNDKPEMIALLRGVAVKKLGSQPQYQWSGWLEQDGQRYAFEQGIIRLRRKPFSLHVRLPDGAALHVHAGSGTRIFDEFRQHNLRTPFNPPRRRLTDDAAPKWLLVSDDKALPPEALRASGVQAWAWTAWERDFARAEPTPQGTVYVRTISELILDNGSGTPEPRAIEQSRASELNIVMGTALSYDKSTAEFVNPVAFKLIFER